MLPYGAKRTTKQNSVRDALLRATSTDQVATGLGGVHSIDVAALKLAVLLALSASERSLLLVDC